MNSQLTIEIGVRKTIFKENTAAPEDVTREVSEEEAVQEVFGETQEVKQRSLQLPIMKTDLQIIDQSQVTLKDGNHGRKANEHCKEDVNSQLTIKKWRSQNNLQRKHNCAGRCH